MEGDKYYKDFEQTANAAISNQGGEYVGDLYLYAHTPESNKDILLSFTGIAMEPNTNETFKFNFTPEEVGTYTLYLTSDYGGTTDSGDDIIGSNIIAQININVEKYIHPIELVSYTYDNNDKYFRLTVKNNGEQPYTTAIIADLYELSGSSYSYKNWYYSWAATDDGNMVAGQTATYNIMFDDGLTAGNSYAVALFYAKDFSSLSTKDFISFETSFFTVDSEGKTTGIEDIENDKNSDAANAPYYTLDGMLLKEKPVKKGIYIHNGKKVVIK